MMLLDWSHGTVTSLLENGGSTLALFMFTLLQKCQSFLLFGMTVPPML
jgi:hypothetical protein